MQHRLTQIEFYYGGKGNPAEFYFVGFSKRLFGNGPRLLG